MIPPERFAYPDLSIHDNPLLGRGQRTVPHRDHGTLSRPGLLTVSTWRLEQ